MRFETVSASWAPDGTRLLLGARVYYRMGPYVPDEQRILLLDPSTGAVRDVTRGTDPEWSGDGRLIAFRDPPLRYDDPPDLVVYDLAAGTEVARIHGTSRRVFGWRGDEVLFWRDEQLVTWRSGVETTVGRAPLPPAGAFVDARFSGDGERAVLSYYRQDFAFGSTPSEVYVLDTRSGTFERLIGAWLARPSLKGHAIFASFLDHRELRLEDGRVLSSPAPLTGGMLVWSPDGRQPLLTPNEFVGMDNTVDLATFDGAMAGVALPALHQYGALNASGEFFAGVRYGGRGPSRLDLFRCHSVPAKPVPTTVTMYYGESSFEPWAAQRDGTAPPGWESLVERDLRIVGLHPIEIGRVRTLEPHILCGQPGCPNGFGLRVVIPFAERDRAYSRCFREPHPGTLAMDAAIGAYRCVPLYPKS